MAIHLSTYKRHKRYSPSSICHSAGQTPRARPLVDRFEQTFGLLGRWIKLPHEPDIFDNDELLEWCTRFSPSSCIYDDLGDEPSPSSHDVYVVTRIHKRGPHSATLLQLGHWSVYTQGHFYHLSAQTRNVACSVRMAANGEEIILKDDDYSPTGDGMASQDPNPPLLIAYHIGQTDYATPEIRDVCNQIIDDLVRYNLLWGNCQHFMSMLIINIVMRRRDNTIFMGTAKQIASWDLGSKRTEDHLNTVEQGLLITAPPVRASTLKGKFKAYLDGMKLDGFINHLAEGYVQGGQDINPEITSPDEYHKQQSFKQSFAPIAQNFRVAMQDLREGRWKDAFLGREVELTDEVTEDS